MPSYIRNTRTSRSSSYSPHVDDIDFGSSPHGDNLPDIDEEPFAHFISPVQDEDDPWDPLSFSAGIVAHDGAHTSKTSKFKSNVANKWTRYVKTNHTPLHASIPEEEEEDEEEAEESFMSLDDDRLSDIYQVHSQLRMSAAEPTRGRAQELLTRKARARRRYSRTLSGYRHSWREPSPDLFTVDESEEDDLPVPVLRRTKTKKTKDGADRRRSSKSRVRGEASEKPRI